MFKRAFGDTQLLIALNFSHDPRRVVFDGRADLLLSTHLDRTPAPFPSPSILREDEGAVLRVTR
jgi:alpha-glucosidase